MYGVDLLGLGSKHWKVKATLAAVPEGFAIGCFDGTTGDAQFGPAIKHLRKLLESGKYPAARIHPWYKKKDPRHPELTACPDDVLKKLAKRYEKLAVDFPGVKIFLSTGCEHNERRKKVLLGKMKILAAYAPHCIPVNNPCQGAMLPGVINETHNIGKSLTTPYIVSTDGMDILNEMDGWAFVEKHKNAAICFLWGTRFNLSVFGEPVLPVAKRTAAPDKKYLKLICDYIPGEQ